MSQTAAGETLKPQRKNPALPKQAMPDIGCFQGGALPIGQLPALQAQVIFRLLAERPGNSGARVGRRQARLVDAGRVDRLLAVAGRIVLGFSFLFALEFVFFLAFFRQLLLALFVGVIGSCHSLAFVNR